MRQWKNITKRPVFFIKSSILVLGSQHPHGICLLAKHVHSASRDDWKCFILGAVYYRSWMECTAVVRTSQNSQFFNQIHDSATMAYFDYSTSAVVRVWASSPAWRYYYNVRFNLWRYHYNVGFNSTVFRWVCYSEGPGEQPDMTTLNEIVNKITWTGVVS